jgi:3-hydroxyisobutyrate dehydrogenase-like beta-hydroxyacid dehydrogenase
MSKKIGFIGAGTMGSRMVERFMSNGFEVTVFNRSKERVEPLVKLGAQAADTIQDLVKKADYICISVSNDLASKDVVNQIIQSECQDKVVISLSTISPDTAEELSKVISAKEAHFLDAPVSGSAPQVESAQLLIFVGGEEAVYTEAQPLFNAIGKASYYLGPAGNGSRMKLVTNTLLGLGAQALAEALLLGQRMGMSKEKMIAVLNDTVVVSPSQKIKMQNALTGEYPPAFSLANMYKDFGLIVEQAHRTSTPMPATVAACQISAVGMAQKLDADFAVVIQVLENITQTAT